MKILPSDTLVDVIESKVAKQLILGTLSLMKEKKGNLKHIGIKITSYLQKLMDREDLTDTSEAKVLRVGKYFNFLLISGITIKNGNDFLNIWKHNSIISIFFWPKIPLSRQTNEFWIKFD